MLDKSAIIKTAQKFLAKGNIDKAIAEWEKLASTAPDGNVMNFMGDLYLKKGDKKSASEAYRKSAKAYTEEGFSHKAIAIYKKILNFNPHDSEALIALGELSEEKAITTDAIKFYIAAADVLSKENKKSELLNVYERILKLAPKNINLRLKIADLFSKEAFVRESAKEYYNVGLLYLDAGNAESARSCLQKSRELQPNSRETLLALSRLYEQSGDFAQARRFISEAIERTGEDPALTLRAAGLLLKAGSTTEAEGMVRSVVEADPSNIEARRQLAALYEAAGERGKAWQQYSVVVDDLMENERVEEAITLLNTYKDLDPVEIGKRLVLYCRQIGNETQAVKELLDLHEACLGFGMQEEAVECLKEALELQPFNQAIKDKLEALEAPERPPEPEEEVKWPSFEAGAEGGGEGAGVEQHEEWPSIEAGQQPEQALWPSEAGGTWPQEGLAEKEQAEEGEKSFQDLLTEADVFLKYGLYSEARTLLDKLKVENPQSADVHLRLRSLYKETGDAEQAVTECIVLSAIAQRRGDEAGSSAFLREAYEINPHDPRLEGKVGLEKSARPATEPAPEAHTGHIEAPFPEQTEAEEEGPFGGPPPQTEGAEPSSEFESLIMDLDREFSAPEAAVEPPTAPDLDSDVADIFEEFKKGLEKEIEAEDAETHYNLGIAYKEMGLVDDSIKEFQVSKIDPKFYVQSMTMLGICYMEKGLYPLAVEAFTGALMKVDRNDDTAWCIKYDLAEAFEKTNKVSEALDLYTQVFGWNAKFRNVSEKINLLRAPSRQQEKPRAKKSRVSYL